MTCADPDSLIANRLHRPVLLVVPDGEGVVGPRPLRHAASLCGQITALMQDGRSQAITLGGHASGGTLVVNGARLSFAVIIQGAPAPPVAGGAIPRG